MAVNSHQHGSKPRVELQRACIRIGVEGAVIVLVLGAVVACRALGSAQPSPIRTASSTPSAAPTVAATQTPTPSATPHPSSLLTESAESPTEVPTPATSSILSGTPGPGDEDTAVSVATKYQTFLKQGQWAKAWAMLSPESRAGEPYDVFVYNWAAIAESWHTLDFTLGTPTHDWQSWPEPDPGYLPRTCPGDYGRAFIIHVDYPFTGQTNFWSVLLIMPTIDGTSWTVSEVR